MNLSPDEFVSKAQQFLGWGGVKKRQGEKQEKEGEEQVEEAAGECGSNVNCACWILSLVLTFLIPFSTQTCTNIITCLNLRRPIAENEVYGGDLNPLSLLKPLVPPPFTEYSTCLFTMFPSVGGKHRNVLFKP